MNFGVKKMKNFIKGIILFICLFITLPSPAIDNNINGISIYRLNGVSWVVPDEDYINSTAIISGITDAMDLSKINNERILFKSDEYIKNLINNRDYYVFSTSYYGDIYVYEFPCNGTLFYSLFAQYLNEQMPYQILTNEIPPEILQKNRNANTMYNKYFDINYDLFTIYNKNLTKDEEKQLKKLNKDEYKKITKIQKYLKKKRYANAIEIDKDFLPTYIFMYQTSLQDKNFGNSIYAMLKLKEINSTKQIFIEKIINYKLGMFYLIFAQLNEAYDYLKEFAELAPSTKDQYLSYALQLIHYYSNNYSTAIFYGNQVKPNSALYTDALSTILSSYQKLNNKTKEKEYTEKLLSITPSVSLYMDYAKFFTNKNDKLNIYYKARNINKSSLDAMKANEKIIEIEQEKINNSVKNTSQFIEVPNWNKYKNSFDYKTQDEFFQKSNDCIKHYKGTNLEKCFASIITYYDDILHLNQYDDNLRQQNEFQDEYLYRLRQLEYEIRNLDINL